MKYIFFSKTIALNIITVIIAIATYMISQPEYMTILPILGLINAVGNIILRVFFTTQPITTDINKAI